MKGKALIRRAGFAFLLLASLAACDTRSISDSGYRDNGWGPGTHMAGNPQYRGELSTYDILGVDVERGASDEDIRKAFASRQPIQIRKGSALMLVQSGAAFPDSEMVGALEKYYTVAAFTGIPLQDTRRPGPNAAAPEAKPTYAQAFRLAAAKGGYETILVYWGVLETATQGLGTKAVSWMPIIGGVIPDQVQRMRIRLMMAVIDTRTGQWETFQPEPFEDEAISNQHARAASDQEQVALLKSRAYKAAADALAARYGR